MSTIREYCNSIIKYSFYTLLFLVPLIFWGNTSELFELNKMWVTYIITLIVLGAWLTEIIAEKQIKIRKTSLDLIIILFLGSQFLSTIFSLDSYVSFWGYYSRFNGGLLSLLCYALLYFAFTSHLSPKNVITALKVSLVSGLFVSLWGLPSHYGFDPTCYVFRGTFDVSCWTEAFKPTIRIFSTLGQPAWMAAYLAALLPITMSFFLTKFISQKHEKNAISISSIYYYVLTVLFYLCLNFTNTKAGFLGFWAVNAIFWVIIFFKQYFPLKKSISFLLLFNISFLVINMLTFFPFEQLNIISVASLNKKVTQTHVSKQPQATQTSQTATSAVPAASDEGITDSGNIRLLVWRGAIDAWKAYPILGTGVETFAFAYYRFRPAAHNMTSEWDYLYNKAHNEFLNYLTTTGLLGLGTYLGILGLFIFLTGKYFLFSKSFAVIKKEERDHEKEIYSLLIAGMFAGWISISITNFFGFSVVIMNLLLFLIPAAYFIFTQAESWYLLPKREKVAHHVSVTQWSTISVLILIIFYCIIILFQYWQADQAYALGYNLDRSNLPQDGYNSLLQAVKIRPSEPVFQDELSLSAIQVALALAQQKNTTTASQLAQQAVAINSDVLANHPNYLPFWKTRIRIFYTLGQLNPNYKLTAVQAAEQAASLAPTDAKIWYNLGVLYAETGNYAKGESVLQKTIEMKPDYLDAYLALGLMYHQMAIDQKNKVIHPDIQDKAVAILQKALQLNPQFDQAKQTLSNWEQGK